MSLFTPLQGLIGGSLIGCSASILLLGNGDIMGASGIMSSVLISPSKVLTDSSTKWKLSFITSFLISSTCLSISGKGIDSNQSVVSTVGYAVSGFLVGFGTKLGNGCTTGHGICGLARFSKRSFIAVCTFMGTGFLTATICNIYTPLKNLFRSDLSNFEADHVTEKSKLVGLFLVAVFTCSTVASYVFENKREQISVGRSKVEQFCEEKSKIIPSIISGSLFSFGLATSGMTISAKIFGFLDLTGFSRGTYDPTLITVMGGGLLVSWMSYQFVKGYNIIRTNFILSRPLAGSGSCQFNVPSIKKIDCNLILGAATFGLGWGIGGICPGPAIFLGVAGNPHVLFHWWPCFALGCHAAHFLISQKGGNSNVKSS